MRGDDPDAGSPECGGLERRVPRMRGDDPLAERRHS